MILIDNPYLSDFLETTILRNKIPVIRTEVAESLLANKSIFFISEKDAIEKVRNDDDLLLYSNSENAIGWIVKNLQFSDLPQKINQFKNKYLFRCLLEDLYPGYFYKQVTLRGLEKLDGRQLPYPLIVKPNVGFFSLGVNKVEGLEEWVETISRIKTEISQVETLYPLEVLKPDEFIIEECIRGEEFAIDCYFNQDGQPVVLNILKHLFSSDKDVNDRVYFTSADIIRNYNDKIRDFLLEVGSRVHLKNFPAHVEVRIDENGKIAPIEFNPMRFGGWCSTPDLAWHAYGMNVYEYFFYKKEPDWNQLLKGKEDVIYSNIVLNNNTGIQGKDIASFNYDKLLADFENPLELRKADYKRFPLFGFLFTETRKDNMSELIRILNSDLNEYL